MTYEVWYYVPSEQDPGDGYDGCCGHQHEDPTSAYRCAYEASRQGETRQGRVTVTEVVEVTA